LNYSLVLKCNGTPALETIGGANQFIMARHRDALSGVLQRPVEIMGCTDLAAGGLKFSGNAQRRKRNALLFHGTFLLRFDLSLMNRFLNMPSREPDYRAGRPHDLFVMNLETTASAVKDALCDAWAAHIPMLDAPDLERLIAEKYGRDDWNLRF
jgi:lipoate-protein ligase A